MESRRGDAGFTLVEVLVATAVLALVAVAVSGIGIAFLMQTGDDARNRQAEATTAQWASVRFARDVQGALGITGECTSGPGSRLITLRTPSSGHDIEYRVTSSGATFGMDRVECGDDDRRSTVVKDLASRPSVTCDGSACVDETTPRVVTLQVSRSSSFDFTLDGVRRTTDGNVDPTKPPDRIPAFMALGGNGTSLSGNGTLTVTGDAYINKPVSGNVAVKMSGNVVLSVSGELLLEDGSILTKSGNAAVTTPPGTLESRVPDPLRFLPVPDTGAMATLTDCPMQSGVRVCQPGIYPGAFPPGASGNSKFRLEPGVYVLRSGMSSSGNVSITGSGVMLYNESGSVGLSGGGELDLSAPSTGIYAGILYFQARTNTASFSLTGNASVTALHGAIYVPAASSVNLASGNGEFGVGQIIGSSLSISGNGTVVVGGG